MKNTKWKQFNTLTGKCYSNMIGAEKDGSCWQRAFELLKEIIHEERKVEPDFALQLEMIEDATDYQYDILGWLDDCLEELDMRGEYEIVLHMCDDLLDLFDWPEYTDSDIKFRQTTALGELGRKEEAENYCRNWIQKEPENIVAATAGIYAFIGVEKYDAAEELVKKFMKDPSICTDDNVIIFTAASKLYEDTGNRKKKRQIDQALEEFDNQLAAYFDDEFLDEDDMDFFDEELPF